MRRLRWIRARSWATLDRRRLVIPRTMMTTTTVARQTAGHRCHETTVHLLHRPAYLAPRCRARLGSGRFRSLAARGWCRSLTRGSPDDFEKRTQICRLANPASLQIQDIVHCSTPKILKYRVQQKNSTTNGGIVGRRRRGLLLI